MALKLILAGIAGAFIAKKYIDHKSEKKEEVKIGDPIPVGFGNHNFDDCVDDYEGFVDKIFNFIGKDSGMLQVSTNKNEELVLNFLNPIDGNYPLIIKLSEVKRLIKALDNAVKLSKEKKKNKVVGVWGVDKWSWVAKTTCWPLEDVEHEQHLKIQTISDDTGEKYFVEIRGHEDFGKSFEVSIPVRQVKTLKSRISEMSLTLKEMRKESNKNQ